MGLIHIFNVQKLDGWQCEPSLSSAGSGCEVRGGLNQWLIIHHDNINTYGMIKTVSSYKFINIVKIIQ